MIRLQRLNGVKGVVSTINAKCLWEVTSNWNLLNESDHMPEFSIDLGVFDILLNQREEWDKKIEAYASNLLLPMKALYYEDLLRDKQIFLEQIFNFLGVIPVMVQGRTHKHTKDDLREVISNFDELRANYVGTPYEAMLDDLIMK